MTLKQMQVLAEKIADSLMMMWGLTPYNTQKEQYLGALCRNAVVGRVTECLMDAASDEIRVTEITGGPNRFEQ
jgi:hypothetical protein